MQDSSKKPYFAQNINRTIQQSGIKRPFNELNENPFSTNVPYLEVNKQVKKDEPLPNIDSFQDQGNQEYLHNNSFQYFLREYDSRNIKFCTEDYSYLSNQMLSRFSQQESAQNISIAYPLFKILRGITKKFMLNELEIIFFLHIIEETKWQFNDPMIAEFQSQFNYDFLNIVHEVYKPDEYKRLILYLVCCAYSIKGYLNENQDVHFINVHINQFIKLELFQRFMDQWRQRFMHGQFRIMPRSINKFFFKLVKNPRDQQKVQIEDYNALVDQIISISPPYSSEKQQTLPPIRKEEVQIQQISQQFMYNFNSLNANNLMTNSKNDQISLSRMNSLFPTNDQFYIGMDNNSINKSILGQQEEDGLNASYQFQQIPSPKKADKKNEPSHEQLKVKHEAGEDHTYTAPSILLRGSSVSAFFQSDNHHQQH